MLFIKLIEGCYICYTQFLHAVVLKRFAAQQPRHCLTLLLKRFKVYYTLFMLNSPRRSIKEALNFAAKAVLTGLVEII